MRPIDADELKKAILEERDKIPLEIVERYSFGVATPNKHGESMRGGIRKALRCLEETPTLDVEPVRHGRWEWDEMDFGYRCSICKCFFDYSTMYGLFDHGFDYAEYCPTCGAKMDAKED